MISLITREYAATVAGSPTKALLAGRVFNSNPMVLLGRPALAATDRPVAWHGCRHVVTP